jgi:hypothetical protein
LSDAQGKEPMNPLFGTELCDLTQGTPRESLARTWSCVGIPAIRSPLGQVTASFGYIAPLKTVNQTQFQDMELGNGQAK